MRNVRLMQKNLQNDALLMRTKMTEVQNDIAQVQKKTGACMEKLEHLDEIKTKLQVYKPANTISL